MTDASGDAVSLPIVIEGNSYLTFHYKINSNLKKIEFPLDKSRYIFFNSYISPEVIDVLDSSELDRVKKFREMNSFRVFKFEFLSAKNDIFDFYVLENEAGEVNNINNNHDYKKLLK